MPQVYKVTAPSVVPAGTTRADVFLRWAVWKVAYLGLRAPGTPWSSVSFTTREALLDMWLGLGCPIAIDETGDMVVHTQRFKTWYG